MRTTAYRTARGISLWEALIAIAVVSFGLLAIAKLHGELTASTGVSKARAEAMQLAETRMEALRNALTPAEYDAATNNLDAGPVDGTNAIFAVSASPDPTSLGGDLRALTVTVSWEDARGETQQVTVTSEAAWNNPLFAVNLARGNLPDGGFIDPPSGSGEMGGELLETGYETVSREGLLEDGTEIRRDGNTFQLVTTTEDGDEALITMQADHIDENDTDFIGFSVIRGRLFFDEDVLDRQGGDSLDPGDVGVIASDAGVCTRVFANGYSVYEEPFPEAELFSDADLERDYFEYQCYVGQSWFGNVGVVRLAEASITDRVCVGDPANEPEPEVIDYEQRPALTTVRRYRGFVSNGDGTYSTIGIGTKGTPEAHTEFSEHDFLVTDLRGNPDHGDCVEPLETGTEFAGNPGRYVCLIKDDALCAPPEDADPTTYWTFAGEYDVPDDTDMVQLYAVFDGEVMECEPQHDYKGESDNVATYGYVCEVNVEGLGEAIPRELRATFDPEGTTICTPELVELEEGSRIDLMEDGLGYSFDGVTHEEHMPEGIDFIADTSCEAY